MQTTKNLRAGDWLDERTLVADIHGGEVDVIHLTEVSDTLERAEKQGQRLRYLRRHREAQARLRRRLREAVGRLS